MSAPRLNSTQQVSDSMGMPTIELLKLIDEMARYIEALEARIAALEP